ncbi:MAG: ATP-binding protein [Elusimicrobiales bacterium]|nr:ATP-binding protein [Elusimicrobiales bacterium]
MIIDDRNKLFIDLENIVNRKYFEEENYEKIKKNLEFLGLNFFKKAYIFLDEIQFLKNIPSVIKYFIDHYNTKFFLSGSSSFYLKNFFNESLAGRKYVFEIFPLSFKEFLSFKNTDFNISDKNLEVSRAIYDTLSPLYDEYMLYGGFPQVVLKDSIEEKERAIEDIFNSYFQLEVVQLGDFKKNNIVRDLMFLLMKSVGSKIDINKISKTLGVSRQSVNEYISFLDGTYFIKIIRPYSTNRVTEIKKAPKVYLCDSGVLNHFSKIDSGLLFENNIFQNLRLRGEVNYYQKKNGMGIDFISNKSVSYEVKWTGDKSYMNKLKRLSDELNIGEYKIVSKNYVNTSLKTVYPFEL